MKDMKKMMFALVGLVFMAACNPSHNNPGESGTVDDGIKAVDQNGALSDADSVKQFNPSVDTALGDDRVDTEMRDTNTYKVPKRQ